jgi:hypothetical protein
MDHNFEHYESASEALLFCRSYLQEQQQRSADYLEGLDAIESPTMCRVALGRLRTALSRADGSAAQHVITLALNAVERALGTRQLLAAS